MGYTTSFFGEFKTDRPLAPEHRAYLKKFAETRRMKRDAAKTALRPDPIREAAGLPVGVDGGYFVNEDGMAGQTAAVDVLNYNDPPEGQPGLWCQWAPGRGFRFEEADDEPTDVISWDGGEKFYNYVEWLDYLIEHFLKRWNYVLNGEVTWEGEDSGDLGKITVENNLVRVAYGKVVYE